MNSESFRCYLLSAYKDLVYNNYPFPKNVSTKNKENVEEKAQNILDIRTSFPDSSLADLYDPLAMPPKLKKAHQELDKAVNKCYTKRIFKSDKERIEFLFGLYEEYVAEEKNSRVGLPTNKSMTI